MILIHFYTSLQVALFIDGLHEWRRIYPEKLSKDVSIIAQSCLDHAYHRILWEAAAKDKTFLYPSESYISVARFVSVFTQIADKYGFKNVSVLTAESTEEEDTLAMLNDESLCFYLLDFFQLNEICGQLLLASDENVS